MVVVTFACMRHALARRRGLTGFACETGASSYCCLLHFGKAGRGRQGGTAEAASVAPPARPEQGHALTQALSTRCVAGGRMMSLELGARAPYPDGRSDDPSARAAPLAAFMCFPCTHGLRAHKLIALLPRRRSIHPCKHRNHISDIGHVWLGVFCSLVGSQPRGITLLVALLFGSART